MVNQNQPTIEIPSNYLTPRSGGVGFSSLYRDLEGTNPPFTYGSQNLITTRMNGELEAYFSRNDRSQSLETDLRAFGFGAAIDAKRIPTHGETTLLRLQHNGVVMDEAAARRFVATIDGALSLPQKGSYMTIGGADAAVPAPYEPAYGLVQNGLIAALMDPNKSLKEQSESFRKLFPEISEREFGDTVAFYNAGKDKLPPALCSFSLDNIPSTSTVRNLFANWHADIPRVPLVPQPQSVTAPVPSHPTSSPAPNSPSSSGTLAGQPRPPSAGNIADARREFVSLYSRDAGYFDINRWTKEIMEKGISPDVRKKILEGISEGGTVSNGEAAAYLIVKRSEMLANGNKEPFGAQDHRTFAAGQRAALDGLACGNLPHTSLPTGMAVSNNCAGAPPAGSVRTPN